MTSFLHHIPQFEGCPKKEFFLEFEAEKQDDGIKRTYTAYTKKDRRTSDFHLSIIERVDYLYISSHFFEEKYRPAIDQIATGDSHLLGSDKPVRFRQLGEMQECDATGKIDKSSSEKASKLIFTDEYISKINDAVYNVGGVTTTTTTETKDVKAKENNSPPPSSLVVQEDKAEVKLDLPLPEKVENKNNTPTSLQEQVELPSPNDKLEQLQNTNQQQQKQDLGNTSSNSEEQGLFSWIFYCGWATSTANWITSFFTSVYNFICCKSQEDSIKQ
jgi:hypothetical protein